ncbi:acetyl-CoA hydrolase/transferase C-terminal domain-containing protein [Desulfosporosinus sp. PR]|uniref:acetyl-CoA hydrolase/transferase family protein n=1 Tax=Candidatus Desulfosporosinus nitrosoreducens TaxID=3401928 RepID=UPI0027FBBE41|nr:acetyl-CoA hydrolase/transferase C-terminal domain-containing protein [Desulfosporosinus sp. PR]MDQ7092302.1 acetyl-CoA hydrolase/transferase C-terminal domain-containing protein [Desulfosporosinus sp. PR]
MDHKREYERKFVSADEAVKVVKSGDVVHYGEFVMASQFLDAALAKRKDELEGVNIRTVCCPFPPQTVVGDPERKHFIYNDWHFSGASRKLHDKNLCNYISLTYHEGPSFYDRGYVPVDVALIKVTPPDEHGYVNLGTANSITHAFCDAAKIVIAEVNNSVPRCLGGSRESLHVSEIDYFVQGDNSPLLQLPDPTVSAIDKKIAQIILGQISDGACLQLGIGAMPNAVGAMIAQSDLKDLGVHTEMLVDSFVDMYEAGRITGLRKQIDKGKMVYTFAMGTNKLYDFLNNNPICASYPVDYTNDPDIICQNDNMICINNAIEVDLYGQVASESSGIRHISGTGGQLDYIYGSYKSKGGKGLICLTSTFADKEGKLQSRIRPTLTPGAIVTVPRSINYYVVTEYGIAMLKGKSTWQRAEALINIAHPDLREELIKEADAQKIWVRSNKIS